MALTFDKYNCSITVKDAGKGKSTLNFNVQALTIETASLTAAAIAAEVQALTNGRVVGWSLSTNYKEDTDFYGNPGSEVENKAEVVFRLVPDTLGGSIDEWAVLRIPAPIDGLFMGTQGDLRDTLNPNLAALQTLLARYYGGVTGLNYTLLASDGQAAADPSISGNVKGGLMHRASTYS